MQRDEPIYAADKSKNKHPVAGGSFTQKNLADSFSDFKKN
jgi:hypothetical protein